MADLETIKAFLLDRIRGGSSPEAAAEQFRTLLPDAPEIDQALAQIRRDMDGNLAPAIRSDEARSPWYVGPRSKGNWARYKQALLDADAPGLKELDASTTRITGLLADPHRRGLQVKGLVMGNVQSGKTRNFAGVIAKASDEGYRLVIVLAGVHNNLRQQTQVRLDRDIFWADKWHGLTNPQGDFGSPPNGESLFHGRNLMAAVVKKNSFRLENLIRWLRAIPKEIRRQVPALIIDDEADQATPNSQEAKNEVSRINKLLRALMQELPTSSYVAYTATPYANVLINPDETADLYPSDFVTTIPAGDGYFGAERVFGISDSVDVHGEASPGLDMVRDIPLGDVAALKPPTNAADRDAFDPELPPSLCDAVKWFLLATATRRARGQNEHSSMLIHSTHYAGPHFAMAKRVRTLLGTLADHLDDASWREMWEAEVPRVREEASLLLPEWDAVQRELPAVIAETTVIVDNGESKDRLDYGGDEPRTVIAVGGGTLSRGLTLEGLCVSYFTRTSTTYDTLLQMGRWFGYRPGYEDLPRLWVPRQTVLDYQFLALVERDLRTEIEVLADSGQTPHAMGVRIRTHPGRLQVTASNKMAHEHQVQMSLSGLTRQTFRLDGSDPGITERAKQAAATLLAGSDLAPVPQMPHRLIAHDIPAALIVEFLTAYGRDAIQSQFMLSRELPDVLTWITENSEQACWNVVVMGNSRTLATDDRTVLGTMTLAGHEVQMLNRAPLATGEGTDYNFKAIMSLPDRVADLDTSDLDGVDLGREALLRRIRHERAGGRGLLLLYPISHRSTPRHARLENPAQARTTFNSEYDHDLLGLGVVFPYVIDHTGKQGSFISVRPRPVFQSTDEEDESDVLEELASLAGDNEPNAEPVEEPSHD